MSQCEGTVKKMVTMMIIIMAIMAFVNLDSDCDDGDYENYFAIYTVPLVLWAIRQVGRILIRNWI